MDMKKLNYVTSMIKEVAVLGREQMKNGNIRKARAAFEVVMSKAKLINDRQHQVTALTNLAAIHISRGEPEIAIEHLKSVLDLKLAHTEMNLGDVHYNMAIAHEMRSHMREAVKELELALVAYKAADASDAVIANVATKTGIILMELGKHKKAIERFNISIGILRKKELHVQLATVLGMKARCLMSADSDKASAVSVADECLELCNSIENDSFVVQLYSELGVVYATCSEFEKSSECYRLALEACDEYDYDSGLTEKRAGLLQNLGAILNSLGKYKEAVEYTQLALDFYASKGMRSSQGNCFLNMAFTYSQWQTEHRMEKCKEYYLHALQAAKDTGDLRTQWQALEGLGGIALYRGQVSKAAQLYQKAVGICASIDSCVEEQNRLVMKLTYALNMKAAASRKPDKPPAAGVSNGADTKQEDPEPKKPSIAQLSPGSVLSQTEITASLKRVDSSGNQPLVELSFYRPPNPEASRKDSAADSGSTSEPKRKRKRKRTRRFSRRSDHAVHDLHGIPQFVHHGLGTYRSAEDATSMLHSVSKDMARKGFRRAHADGEDVSSSKCLKIQGLAVDDASERRNYYDELDSPATIRVRPINRSIRTRPNSLFSSSDSDDTLVGDGDKDMSSSSDDLLIPEPPRKTNWVKNRISSPVWPPPNTSDKGKRPRSGKALPPKSSATPRPRQPEQKKFLTSRITRKDTLLQMEGDNKETKLDDYLEGDEEMEDKEEGDEDNDEEAVREQMRKIHDQNYSFSSDSDASDYKNGKSETGSSDSSDLRSEKRAAHTDPKFQKPFAGGNFFKSKGQTSSGQVNETVATSASSMLQGKASPGVKKDNEEDSFYSSDDDEDDNEVDVSKMTTGQRDSYLLSMKRQHTREKKVTWKGNQLESRPETRKSQQSQACSLM